MLKCDFMDVYGFCVGHAVKHTFCNKFYCQILNVEFDFFQVFQNFVITSFWTVGMLVGRKRLICVLAHKKSIQGFYFT